MPQTVEISLRIPSLRVRHEVTEAMQTISNSDVRFIKHIAVDSIPKAGTILTMEIASHGSFESVVVRSDWHEGKNLFVVACQFKNRSIAPADYQALLDAPAADRSPWHDQRLALVARNERLDTIVSTNRLRAEGFVGRTVADDGAAVH